MLAAILHPSYMLYKTLAHGPTSEADLEHWLMYWGVLSCVGTPMAPHTRTANRLRAAVSAE